MEPNITAKTITAIIELNDSDEIMGALKLLQ
jgi:hypothetical protein